MSGPELLLWEPKYNGDFLTLTTKSQESNGISRWITSCLIRVYHRYWGSDHHATIDPESGMILYSDEWFSRMGKVFTTTVSSVLPTLAVLALYFEKNLLRRIYIMIGITALFALVLSIFSNARRVEIFGAVAT